MKNLEKRTHNKLRALFAENKVRFARAEQGFRLAFWVARTYVRGSIFGRTVRWGYRFSAFSYETEANQ